MPYTTPKFKDIQAVIFDWSGVISDDRLPVYQANKVVVEKYGVKHEDFDDWLFHTTGSAPTYFASRGIKADPNELMEEYRLALHGSKTRGIHPIIYSDAKETLKLLAKSKKLFVVSTHPHDHLLREADGYGIQKYFSDIAGEVKDKAETIKNLVTSPTLFVGDTIFDIIAAQKAGVMSVGITTGYQTREQLAEQKPNLIVDSLTQLLHHFSHRYVDMEDKYMQMAKEYAQKNSLDLVMPTASVIVKDGKVIGMGANGSDYHKAHECERVKQGIPTGQGYELCEGCHPKNHSEPRAISQANDEQRITNNADLYLWGHWWCCEPCWSAMITAGIRDVYLLDNSEILFNKNHPDNIVWRQLRG